MFLHLPSTRVRHMSIQSKRLLFFPPVKGTKNKGTVWIHWISPGSLCRSEHRRLNVSKNGLAFLINKLAFFFFKFVPRMTSVNSPLKDLDICFLDMKK